MLAGEKLTELIGVSLTVDDIAHLEKMRARGGEHCKLAAFIRSLLRNIIAVDKMAGGTK